MNLLDTTLRITGAVLVVQLLLGGLVTFNYISVDYHIAVGLTLFALSIIVLAISFISKPTHKRIQGMSIGVVLLLVIQIALGFDTLHTGSQAVAYLHFVNALIIYGLILTESMVASRLRKENSRASPSA